MVKWSLSKPVLFISLLLYLDGSNALRFRCPETHGQYADADDCHVFYQCENNVSYRKVCPPGALYDGGRHTCVNRYEKVNCGPQPTTEATTTTVDPNAPSRCDPTQCQVPYCFCSVDGTQIPGGLEPKETPQMIMITFDGAVNHLNGDIYNTIFLDNRTNPNDCPIRGTFFVTHQYSDYARIQEFASKGHEIAVASVTRRIGLEDEPVEAWVGEMVTMREILKNFASVVPEDVVGMRAPHIKPGRNKQFDVIYDYGFYWDSSMVVPPIRMPVWPYTLDYEMPHECRSGTCPTSAYPGVWEIPMNSHYEDERYDGGYCPYLDQCGLNFFSEDDVLNWLKKDFHRHYDQNKAPYLVSVSVNWFNTAHHHRALLRFVDYTLTLPDVYYTTLTEAVQWMSNPTPVAQLTTFSDFDCKLKTLPPAPCTRPKSCPLILSDSKIGVANGTGGTRYMGTCERCPSTYPWLFDARGIGRDTVDTYPKVSFK